MNKQLRNQCKKLANAYNVLVASRMKDLSKNYNVPLDKINDLMNSYI